MILTQGISEDEFLQDTRSLIRYAGTLSDGEIAVQEDETSRGHLATVNIVSRPGASHIISYQPGQRQIRDHLVSHECSHLIRYYSATPEGRVIPVSNRDHRRHAAYELAQPLVRYHNAGLPDSALGELLDMWHQGLVKQLVNYPADFRIERSLKEDYPGLADQQDKSIRHQLKENDQVLKKRVAGATPTKVYEASVTMNAAFARYMCLLYDDDSLAGAYRRSHYWSQGKDLADEVWSTDDRGYESDVSSATGWAQLFGVEDWFEWRYADEIKQGSGR